MRKKFIERELEKKINEKCDVEFEYNEIKDKIDFSAYKTAKTARPAEKKKFNFALFGSLAAAALAIVIAAPFIAFAAFGGAANGTAKAGNRAENDAAVGPADYSTDVGAGYNDIAAPERDGDNNDEKACDEAAGAGGEANAGWDSAYVGEVQKADTIYYEAGEWSCKCKKAEGAYVISEDGTARIRTDDGVYHDIAKSVRYKNADGTEWFMDESVFANGERVTVLIATEVNPENKESTVKVGEAVHIIKQTQYVSPYDTRAT